MPLRGWIRSLPALALALLIGSSVAAEEKPDAAWSFSVSCFSRVHDCVLLVATGLGDLTERFPAETHRIVAMSNATQDGRGRVMTAAWIGISPARPESLGDRVFVPDSMFSAMAMREPLPGAAFSEREIRAAEAATLAAAVRSMVEECYRTPECASHREERLR